MYRKIDSKKCIRGETDLYMEPSDLMLKRMVFIEWERSDHVEGFLELPVHRRKEKPFCAQETDRWGYELPS